MLDPSAEIPALDHRVGLWAANDPVEPIHDYNIPILPFKHPPTRDDFQQIRRRRKRNDSDKDQPRHDKPTDDGHVDDYA
jgi:hypothetical protein